MRDKINVTFWVNADLSDGFWVVNVDEFRKIPTATRKGRKLYVNDRRAIRTFQEKSIFIVQRSPIFCFTYCACGRFSIIHGPRTEKHP